MDKNNRLKFEEWMKYAEEDLHMAKLAVSEKGPPNQICFHAQQTAEKYIKGFLVLHGKQFEKTHQLPYLLDVCITIDNSFESLKEYMFYLTRFYIETRYPGNIPEFNKNEAEKALSAALEIKKFILEKTRF